jgi:SAM-dependent methyltransferase
MKDQLLHTHGLSLPFPEALDIAHGLVRKGHISDAMYTLGVILRRTRDVVSNEEWRSVIGVVRDHPVLTDFHRGPVAYRSFFKPRGYNGDAETLDLIYGLVDPEKHDTIDAAMYAAEFGSGVCRSVRDRRNLLAEFIDTACEKERPRVLSVACGHLREAALSHRVARHSVEIVGFDQDEASLSLVEREYGRQGVLCKSGNVARLIVGAYDLGSFDVIYSAGLYDYLSTKQAIRLTATLHRMLRPGGKLLLANFAPNLLDAGYMEAVQDWFLVHRDEVELEKCLAGIPDTSRECARFSRDPQGNIVYVEIASGKQSRGQRFGVAMSSNSA